MRQGLKILTSAVVDTGHLGQELRTGSWRDVDQGTDTYGTTTPYARRHQKIYLKVVGALGETRMLIIG